MKSEASIPDPVPHRTRSRPVTVNTRERWKAVSSSVRFELLVNLERLGPCSIAALAEQMGRPADSLYHHVRQLVAVGLVAQKGQQQPGRNPEAVYDVAGDSLLFDFDPDTGRHVDEAVGFGNSLFRAASRVHEKALRGGVLNLPAGPGKDFHLRYESARLGPAEIAKVNELLGELKQVLDSAPSDPTAPVYKLAWFMAPESSRRKD